MKVILIKVLRRDIKAGIRERYRSCPVALAVRRARIMPKKDVFVGSGTLDCGRRWKYPAYVEAFIHKFDFGKKVSPISFVAYNDE